MEIAAASRVDVSTQVASAVVVWTRFDSRGMIGVASVCMKAPMSPVSARVVVIERSLGRLVRRALTDGEGGVCGARYRFTLSLDE